MNEQLNQMNMDNKELTVLDVFCGAGGFSEGFRQQGFKIVKGLDYWKPAVATFNHNFGLQNEPKNVLEYWDSTKLINKLPDTDVILGGPPCQNFSRSNSRNPDPSKGLKTIKCFLRIVAVKKHQVGSRLKAWYMENVPPSTKHLPKLFTFESLNLSTFAKSIGKPPIDPAVYLNGCLVNAALYGAPQRRKRVIFGGLVSHEKIDIPPTTHCEHQRYGLLFPSSPLCLFCSKKHAPVVREVENALSKDNNGYFTDPVYNFELPRHQLTDQFYNTDLTHKQWLSTKVKRLGSANMGRQVFPDCKMRTSRTVTAVEIYGGREIIVYKTERGYRMPTIRECATYQSFPLTYQFLGKSHAEKRRLVGNAVCVSVSNVIAKSLRKALGLAPLKNRVTLKPVLEGVKNLNEMPEKSNEKRTYEIIKQYSM